MLGSTTRAGLAPRLFTPKITAPPRTPDSYGFFGNLRAFWGYLDRAGCRISGHVKAPRWPSATIEQELPARQDTSCYFRWAHSGADIRRRKTRATPGRRADDVAEARPLR